MRGARRREERARGEDSHDAQRNDTIQRQKIILHLPIGDRKGPRPRDGDMGSPISGPANIIMSQYLIHMLKEMQTTPFGAYQDPFDLLGRSMSPPHT